ncbi:protein-L-isoaspartate O-methyltransferase [Bosea sp. (in: a-proteobacteria)]|uniref:protein-L-isoaspartate O-methyltransferase family protein n=1 Tax=Bosea sp. (in: a-proteobacteria) TaxID=1871050 RepID=UPI001AD5B2EE|nr:protein-L-isoaspartate O-methyltransferase [Bosea sp. (in: a-proteobacteria)]MBN9444632.1 protein-L-isoaspartate O-methyltransferase [Bosea sp. (in: a-proteobacteria)]
MEGFSGLRRNMVDCQLRTYDVTDRAVLAAADEVPRELFVPEGLAYLAYLDQAIELPGTGRALMTPMVIARMIQVLDLEPGEDALEYGGGTGYGAALMDRMGVKATLWEPDDKARALAITALAAAGCGVLVAEEEPAKATFDAILVSGACETEPKSLFSLLRSEGRLIVVEGAGRSARVKLYQKSGNVVAGRTVFDAAAPELAEFRRPAEFVF